MPFETATSDLERNRMPDIFPEPWLTDTSISPGSWAYAANLKLYSADRIIHDLVDIVSKNGCLLLSIAPHPDGTIPGDQQERLRSMGRWLRLNGEAIYGTRPWLIFGEGPTVTPVGHLSDNQFGGFGEEDIRFTTGKDGMLYAIALGWPENGALVIKTFSTAKYNTRIRNVELLGHDAPLSWEQTLDGLEIKLPAKAPCQHAYVFRITR
jgi:alpha-L-fucosidase